MALLRLFGHPVLERDGTRVAIGVPPKALALLAVLAANHTRPLSREWLAQSLWPDVDPADARANLRRHLHLLSRTVGDDALLLARHTAQWNVQASTSVDVARFDTFSGAEPALAAQEYGGELCAGVEDEILEPLRLRYRSAYEELLRKLTSSARAAADDAALAVWLQHSLNHDPFDESVIREMMLLRRRHGDRAGALREYTAFAQRLRSELGSEPDPQTAALYAEIAGDEAGTNARHNLQANATTFVGRERELAALAHALQEHGFVTLTGSGGIGKTRLATRACFDLLPAYPDGVWFVELDHCEDAAGIWERLATAMQIPASAAPEKRVIEELGSNRVLLFFDTCEHVLEHARRVVQTLLEKTGSRILATSRRALRTPREHVIAVGPLDIPPADLHGESPLRFGAYRLFLERAAMINPTFRVVPRQMRALTEVLQQVDGLPLAIELVASRANVLTIEGMRKRLAVAMRAGQRTAANARAQTIDDAIAWSYDLLSQEQRHLFACLSVFKGSFDIDDVESVCGGLEHWTESLFELVDASLVSIVSGDGQGRYRMLETTRAFAYAKFASEENAQQLHQAHAEHFAAKADALLLVPEDGFADMLERLYQAMPDYLSALDYACNSRRIPCAMRLFEALQRFGIRYHFINELIGFGQRLLEITAAAERARIARLTGMLKDTMGEHQGSANLFEIAAAYYRESGDEAKLCDVLSGLAVVAFHLGRYDECERQFLEVRERTERSGDKLLHLKTLGRLGALYLSQGQLEKSIALLDAAADGLRTLGELRQRSYALKNLGTAFHYAGRQREAIARLDQALECTQATSEIPLHANAMCVRACALRELGDMDGALDSLIAASGWFVNSGGSDLAECLEDAASTICALGEHRIAARLIGFCDAVRAAAGSPVNPGLRAYYDRTDGALRDALGAEFAALRAQGAKDTREDACALAGKVLSDLKRDRSGDSLLAG